jgi:hypothetical protein
MNRIPFSEFSDNNVTQTINIDATHTIIVAALTFIYSSSVVTFLNLPFLPSDHGLKISMVTPAWCVDAFILGGSPQHAKSHSVYRHVYEQR